MVLAKPILYYVLVESPAHHQEDIFVLIDHVLQMQVYVVLQKIVQ